MRPNTKILADALEKLRLENGLTWDEITAESGVHNISRIANLKITPTESSWEKLHNAFPNDIPEIEYINNSGQSVQVVSKGSGISVGNATSVTQNRQGFSYPTKHHEYACNLIMDADEDKVKEVIALFYNT